ncbi:MAG: response regulator transcription factor [Burkholderiales bacterium]|nr:response regulator transcription factor [Flavobacterium sp.]
MKHSYIIIDDDPQSILKIRALGRDFVNLQFVGAATNYEQGLDMILEHHPKIVFLEIDPLDINNNLSLLLINELYRYLIEVPKIIITTKTKDFAYEAVKYEVFDYFLKPLQINEFRKTILKFERTVANLPQSLFQTDFKIPTAQEIQVDHPEKTAINEMPAKDEIEMPSGSYDLEAATELEKAGKKFPNYSKDKPLIICVKSYGDYRFIEAKDICYLQADNNSTDIHLYNGEMITAFKTLKHFESVLNTPFVRIHNSYIVNIDYVSRIHTGNAVCYIKNTTTKLPFSKSYKENVDSIINSITMGNYLEI